MIDFMLFDGSADLTYIGECSVAFTTKNQPLTRSNPQSAPDTPCVLN